MDEEQKSEGVGCKVDICKNVHPFSNIFFFRKKRKKKYFNFKMCRLDVCFNIPLEPSVEFCRKTLTSNLQSQSISSLLRAQAGKKFCAAEDIQYARQI